MEEVDELEVARGNLRELASDGIVAHAVCLLNDACEDCPAWNTAVAELEAAARAPLEAEIETLARQYQEVGQNWAAAEDRLAEAQQENERLLTLLQTGASDINGCSWCWGTHPYHADDCAGMRALAPTKDGGQE